jgi:hypothetical protein
MPETPIMHKREFLRGGIDTITEPTRIVSPKGVVGTFIPGDLLTDYAWANASTNGLVQVPQSRTMSITRGLPPWLSEDPQ